MDTTYCCTHINAHTRVCVCVRKQRNVHFNSRGRKLTWPSLEDCLSVSLLCVRHQNFQLHCCRTSSMSSFWQSVLKQARVTAQFQNSCWSFETKRQYVYSAACTRQFFLFNCLFFRHPRKTLVVCCIELHLSFQVFLVLFLGVICKHSKCCSHTKVVLTFMRNGVVEE